MKVQKEPFEFDRWTGRQWWKCKSPSSWYECITYSYRKTIWARWTTVLVWHVLEVDLTRSDPAKLEPSPAHLWQPRRTRNELKSSQNLMAMQKSSRPLSGRRTQPTAAEEVTPEKIKFQSLREANPKHRAVFQRCCVYVLNVLTCVSGRKAGRKCSSLWNSFSSATTHTSLYFYHCEDWTWLTNPLTSDLKPALSSTLKSAKIPFLCC